ncbi:SDR family oxidoreductase [Glaciihabitans sp. dw_435]|uniref:SDR family oxidoreductase n=1 Tax=Glaciihabitans sp. dw_435 TaxID=2720081 RepID=UPI001BD3570B|nr:SDR family oxidoreductase [Glaciihabitans sp. dw_435]
MRVFVTGASGFIGSAVVAELLAAGHEVTGLARSDASAAAITASGAQVLRGSLDDLEGLRAGADTSDGVIHLAYNHDFSQYLTAGETDRLAIEAMGSALAGTDRPLVIASGVLGLNPGRLALETDGANLTPADAPRIAGAQATLALAGSGVRSSIVRLAPSVHNRDKEGFMGLIVDTAKAKGVAAYIGDGANRWPAVHVLDAAHLFVLALEKAPAGSILHGVGEEGVRLRDVAEVIGRHLDVPVVSLPASEAGEHFAWMGAFIGADAPASSAATQELVGWTPSHPGLLDDLEHGHFFE